MAYGAFVYAFPLFAQPGRAGLPTWRSSDGLHVLHGLHGGNHGWTRLGQESADDFALLRDELVDALVGEREQRVELIPVERVRLRRALQLDELAARGFDHVHVNFGG